jgi:two-component system, NtrC family, response regulator HydG
MSITNVLVVDDDIAVCRILHRMLSDEQYQVQLSQSVANALGAIDQKPFDVYVMDYKLPDGTGLDVAERIRSKGSDAPIILISGYDPSAVALRAEKLRIFDIIEKPFSRATICNAVKKAIGFAPIAEQRQADLVSPNPAAKAEAAEPAAAKRPFPMAAMVGVIIFLLLSCVTIYLLIHPH